MAHKELEYVLHTSGDVVHRIGIWLAMVGVVVYVLNIGAWVGAADEKFVNGDTVKTKQEEMIVTQTIIATKQDSIEKAVEANKKAIEASRKEILAAIEKHGHASVHADDD
jgi:hypothetical protein